MPFRLLPFVLAGLVSLHAFIAAPAEAGIRRIPRAVLEVDQPSNGAFSQAATVAVTGTVRFAQAGTVLTINDDVVTLGVGGVFSHTITLDAAAVTNPIYSVLTTPDQNLRTDRRVVFAGDSVADGDFSLGGIALRLNDTGLDQIEPAIGSLVSLDPATLIPPGTQVIDEFCYLDLFGLCIGSADGFVEGTPPPSVSGFGIDIDSQQDAVFGDILLNDLFLRARIEDGNLGIGFECFVNVNAATTDILGDFGLQPDAADPSLVDVFQVGGVQVVFSQFTDSTDCSGIFGGILEFFIGVFIGDIQSLFSTEFANFLNATDAAGNTPVAGAIETALADIEISGPIGEGLGVMLETPLFDVLEDIDGITLGSDTRVITQVGTGPGECIPPPAAPDLAASYHIAEPFPTLTATTPVGGLPYDLGICISTSAFNQLLKADTECGLLQLDVTEIDVLGVPTTITAGVLTFVIPEFTILPTTLPLLVRITPTTAPFLTGNPGPAGETSELKIANLIVEVRRIPTDPVQFSYVTFGVDLAVGLDFVFDDLTGELVPTVGSVDPADITVGVIDRLIQVSQQSAENGLPTVLAEALPVLGASLGSFPIPAFFGLGLQSVEVSNQGEFLSIFADLVTTP